MSEQVVMFVSVAIPHYNDVANLTHCLACLRRQTWPSDFEIVIADNNSSGGVAAVQGIAPDARVVPAVEQGAGPARNTAAAVASGEVLAFIDSDCLADENWLTEGIKALARHDYVGGRVITAIGDPARITAAEAYEAVFAFDFKKYIEKQHYSGSGNLFVPKAVFERVGGFRAGVAEDMEWCWRANAAGYRLGYAEKAIVRHAARCNWSELKRKHDRMQREELLLAREQRGWRRRWLLHAALVAASPCVHWLRVLRSPRLPGVRARFKGLQGLIMIRGYRSYSMVSLLFTGRSAG